MNNCEYRVHSGKQDPWQRQHEIRLGCFPDYFDKTNARSTMNARESSSRRIVAIIVCALVPIVTMVVFRWVRVEVRLTSMKLSVAASRLQVAIPITDYAPLGSIIPPRSLTPGARLYVGIGQTAFVYKREPTYIYDSAYPDLVLTMVYYIPLWPIALASTIALIELCRRSLVAPRKGCCPKCGYDTRACTGGRCSECGELIQTPGELRNRLDPSIR